MDFLWPLDLPVFAQQLTLEDSTAAFQATMAAKTYTVGRGADRWRMSVECPVLSGANRTRLINLLAATRGRTNRLYIPDHSYIRNASGGFASSELLSNTAFASTTGWTAVSGASLSVNNGRLRVTKTASGSSVIHGGAVTVTANLAYVARALVVQGRGAASVTLSLGSTAGGTDYGTTSASTAFEMLTLAGVPTGTTVYVSLTVTGITTGDWFEVGYATFARCLRLDNSVTNPQTGTAVLVQNAPTSTQNLLMAGDLVEIQGSGLHRVVAPFDSDSSGIGALMVSPPARGTNSDDAAVIVHAPMLRGIIEAGNPSYSTEPGRFSKAQLDVVEAFA